MKTFIFTVELTGHGDTPENAWDNATDGFTAEPGPCPDQFSIEEDESDSPEEA